MWALEKHLFENTLPGQDLGQHLGLTLHMTTEADIQVILYRNVLSIPSAKILAA